MSDRSPSELGAALGMGSNLLAHHLSVLEGAGLVARSASAGDGRRRYLRLLPDALVAIAEPVATLLARHVLFVCTANSARSQLAAAAWNATHDVPASSAGTHPAAAVHPGRSRRPRAPASTSAPAGPGRSTRSPRSPSWW